MDNLGGVFISLLQANSDDDIMEIYLMELVKMLDSEDEHWRQDTVLIWDGASYHTSLRTQSLLEKLKVPMMQLGPYSYDIAPAELLFARLKTSDLHPGEIAVGKKNFANVVNIVVESISKIPKAIVLMMWHHVLLEAFNFLLLKPL